MSMVRPDFTVPQTGVVLRQGVGGMGGDAVAPRALVEKAVDFTDMIYRAALKDADGYITTDDPIFQKAKDGASFLNTRANFASQVDREDMNSAGRNIFGLINDRMKNIAYNNSNGAVGRIQDFLKPIGELKDILDNANVNLNGADDIARRKAEASDSPALSARRREGAEAAADAKPGVGNKVKDAIDAALMKPGAPAIPTPGPAPVATIGEPAGQPLDVASAAALPVVQMSLDRAASATSLSGKVEGVNAALAELKAGVMGQAEEPAPSEPAGPAGPAAPQGVVSPEPILEYGSQVIGKVAELVSASRENLESEAVPADVSDVEEAAGNVIDTIASILSITGEGAQAVTADEFGSFINALMNLNSVLAEAYEGKGGDEERLASEVLDASADWISGLGETAVA